MVKFENFDVLTHPSPHVGQVDFIPIAFISNSLGFKSNWSKDSRSNLLWSWGSSFGTVFNAPSRLSKMRYTYEKNEFQIWSKWRTYSIGYKRKILISNSKYKLQLLYLASAPTPIIADVCLCCFPFEEGMHEISSVLFWMFQNYVLITNKFTWAWTSI